MPANWGPPTIQDGGGSGATFTYASPNGVDSVQIFVSGSYGFNHNVAAGVSEPFDPGDWLPAGCAITGSQGYVYPFNCSNGNFGFVFTQPATSGGVMVTASGPDASLLSQILDAMQLYNADIGL